ncbi:MAG: STAS domain-containing protein [Planctomycetota bacterium]|nr:STAS domain-containing protein [Planctomycetota bacterium]
MSPSSSYSKPGEGHFLVAKSDDIVFVQVVGLGTMNNSIGFQQFIVNLEGKERRKFIFDLSLCDGFDSTFMGILLGISREAKLVVLVNTLEDHSRILGEVGIDKFVQLCDSPVELPEIELQRLESRAVSQNERQRVVLSAHENLVQLDSRNKEEFGQFVDLLRDELGDETPL